MDETTKKEIENFAKTLIHCNKINFINIIQSKFQIGLIEKELKTIYHNQI